MEKNLEIKEKTRWWQLANTSEQDHMWCAFFFLHNNNYPNRIRVASGLYKINTHGYTVYALNVTAAIFLE